MQLLPRIAVVIPLFAAACAHTPKAERLASESIARGSDPRAVAIAEEVVAALGGDDAWNSTRVLEWNFFGRRAHVWDKRTGDYRLDDGEKVVLMNLETGAGRVFENGIEIVDATRRAEELKRAKSIWINDSYWLIMPFKLLDPGVTLKDAGQRKLASGMPADVLRVTFDSVGDTPRNAYDVFVTRDSRRVAEWAYFEDADDAQPKLTSPWTDWKKYGAIYLSSGRGPNREITDIAVLDTPPAKLRQP